MNLSNAQLYPTQKIPIDAGWTLHEWKEVVWFLRHVGGGGGVVLVVSLVFGDIRGWEGVERGGGRWEVVYAAGVLHSPQSFAISTFDR